MIEEELFYPQSRNNKVDDDILDEAYVEHDGAKVLIAEILASAPEDEFYDAKVTVLSEEIKHHVREEEKPFIGIFAQAKRSDLDMNELGAKLAARKQQLKEKFEKEGLPPPKTRTLQGAKLSYGKPVEGDRDAA
jgi:CO dehydrogenase/acetyl-CoA synthase beta subunit